MKTVLLLARDPGGANTVFPLKKPLQAKGYKTKLFGKDEALNIYRKFGLSGENILGYINAVDIKHCKKFLQQEKPDFVITGTSGDDFTERYIWAAAAELGIPSLAIVDQWMNGGIRFSEYSAYRQERYWQSPQARYLPSKVLAIDAEQKQQLIEEGIPEDRISVSGHPYFQIIDDYRKTLKPDEIPKSRSELLGQNDEQAFIISFISEPISRYYPSEDKHFWGYNEKTILAELLQALEKIAPLIDKEINLFIKPHPRENRADHLYNETSFPIKIRLTNDYDNWRLLLASDLVCGMSSMLLLEAVLLGRPVLSIQIGLQREDPFILSRRKILPAIYKAEQLLVNLEIIFKTQEFPVIDWRVELQASKKVISIMEGMI